MYRYFRFLWNRTSIPTELLTKLHYEAAIHMGADPYTYEIKNTYNRTSYISGYHIPSVEIVGMQFMSPKVASYAVGPKRRFKDHLELAASIVKILLHEWAHAEDHLNHRTVPSARLVQLGLRSRRHAHDKRPEEIYADRRATEEYENFIRNNPELVLDLAIWYEDAVKPYRRDQ